MLNLRLYFKILFLSFLFFSSCKKNEQQKLNNPTNKKLDNYYAKKESSFLLIYDSIKKSSPKSFQNLKSNFFNTKNPHIKYYALYCYYCLHKSDDESLSEEYSLFTFEMFDKNKQISDDLIKYIYQLEKKDRDAILISIVELMCLDLGDNEYTVEEFNNNFQSLSKNKEVQKSLKKCLENVVW